MLSFTLRKANGSMNKKISKLQELQEAIERNTQEIVDNMVEMYKIKIDQVTKETYSDYPKAATNNAKRAIKYKEESGNPKGCGTAVGWTRARQLANREALSRDTIARMSSFNRHRQNKDVPYEEGCGGLMWDAWGGTEGIDWAQRKLKEIDNKE